MRNRNGQRGLTLVDVVVVAGLVAALIFVATLEFPRFEQHQPPPPAAAE